MSTYLMAKSSANAQREHPKTPYAYDVVPVVVVIVIVIVAVGVLGSAASK